ncbi:hypothetical protein [Alteromonas gracilis]|uniref:hypothetical protein n=1 Tax=Alteromonas gracilis TaxID=1479524 RepID=UPI003736FC5F
MTAQLAFFDEPVVPDVRWIEVTKKPSITWLFDNAARAFKQLEDLSEEQFVKTWKAVGLASFMFRRNITPKGFVYSRHKHLIHQIGSKELVNKVGVEFKRRGLDKCIGLDISISE